MPPKNVATYITDEAILLTEVGNTKTAAVLKKADPKLLNDKGLC